MVLKRIAIRNFGTLERFEYDFEDGLNIINSRHTDEISHAICLTLGHKYFSLPEYRTGRNSVIEALVGIGEKEFYVVIKNKSCNLCLNAHDKSGNELTKEYLYLTSHCREQDVSDVFGGGNKTFFKLLQYLDEDRHYSSQELSKRTEMLSETKSFRSYLKSFIANSKPELIHDGKRYELCLDAKGKYVVRYRGDNDTPVFLSESEQTLFRYLCFLKTAEFWQGFEELRNIHSVKKPILIKDFLERLDETVDTQDMLERTRQLNRQIIVLTV